MIQLARPAEPDCLVRRREQWTARWTRSLNEGARIDWATRTAKQALRGPLIGFSYGKCSFCESTLDLTSFAQIEHYHSKYLHPNLAFHWPNLFPCCEMCNQHKGDIEHQGRLLKPDIENPEPLLWLHPGSGELQPHPTLNQAQEERVLATLEAYDLQRGALCEQRIRTMNEINRWLRRVVGQQDMSRECREEWVKIIEPRTPLKFVIRHVLTLGGYQRLAEMDRGPFLPSVESSGANG